MAVEIPNMIAIPILITSGVILLLCAFFWITFSDSNKDE